MYEMHWIQISVNLSQMLKTDRKRNNCNIRNIIKRHGILLANREMFNYLVFLGASFNMLMLHEYFLIMKSFAQKLKGPEKNI